MEKLRQHISDLLKAFDESKQIEFKAIQENHQKELKLARDSKTFEVLRLNKVQTDLIKTHNSQSMKLKLEFALKESILKNKIKKMSEAHEKKLLELTEMHENQAKSLNKKLEEMGCEHNKKLEEVQKYGSTNLSE